MKEIYIVTGGASGLGYCIAELLVKSQKNVCIVSRTEESLNLAWDKLKTQCAGNSVEAIKANVAVEEDVDSVFEQLSREDYYVKKVFNCAGQGQFGAPENNTRAMIDIAFEGSLIGVILMSSKALTAMKDAGGMIINIMSTAALKGNPNETIYCAAKWGARGFCEALRAYTKGSNIKVVSVFPGGMNTPFWGIEKCNMLPKVSTFMNPYEVAEKIINATDDAQSLYVSELTIDRK